MPPLREEREVSRQEKGGILKGGRQGRMGVMRAEEQGRSLQSAEVAGRGHCVVRDPCQLQSGQRQTAWLTHGLCLAKDTLSPAYAMQDKDSMFQVGITTLKFKAANPRALGGLSTRPSHCWSMGGQDPLDHRLRGLLGEGRWLHWHRAQPSVRGLTSKVSGSSRRYKERQMW